MFDHWPIQHIYFFMAFLYCSFASSIQRENLIHLDHSKWTNIYIYTTNKKSFEKLHYMIFTGFVPLVCYSFASGAQRGNGKLNLALP